VRKRRAFLVIAGLALAIAGYELFAPDVVEPNEPWVAPEPPPLLGVLEPNTTLSLARPLARGQIRGPESVTVDAAGRVYSGTADGRIVRIDVATDRVETYARTGTASTRCGEDSMEHVCGRPLGLRFDAAGDLIVADAFRGLMKIDAAGRMRVLTSSAGGVPFRFTDDLDIASDGRIYFSDASSKYDRAHYRNDVVEGNGWGRLMRYDPATKKTEVLESGLRFANGVTLTHDESAVLVAETGRYRVHRHHLRGPKAGTTEVFIDNLPGFPDNIRRASDGGYWVALGAKRSKIVDYLHARPTLKRIIAKTIPLDAFQKYFVPKVGVVVHLDARGPITRAYWDPTGEVIADVSEASEHDGRLYIGSIANDRIGVLDLRAQPKP
jgi:sugar lactone lactonase YvrE